MKLSDLSKDELSVLDRAICTELVALEYRGVSVGRTQKAKVYENKLEIIKRKIWAELHGTEATDVEGA